MENEKDLREKLEQMTKEELVDFAVRQTNVKNTYMEIIMSMNNKTFKKKTETLDHYQISLFDEIESTYEQAIPEELDESLIQPKPKKKKRTKTKETDYSNLEKKILFCVGSRNEIIRIKKIATNIDNKSFIVIFNAREVLGKGFEKRQKI